MFCSEDEIAQLRAVLAAYDAFGTMGAARHLGIPKSTLQGRLSKARILGVTADGSKPRIRLRAAIGGDEERFAALRGEVGGPPIPDIARPPEGFVISRNGGSYDADGNLLRQWIGTKRDAGDFYDVPPGHVVKGESALLDQDGRLMARWIKTREGASEGLVDALRETFAEYEGRAGEIAAPEHTDDALLTVYPLPDLHVGMFAWARECGDSYDIKIATDLITKSLGHLVAQSRPSRHAVVLGLGDLFHTNDQTNATPAHKHRLDVDGRWPKVYRAGATLMTSIVDMVAAKHDQVEVVNLPGNHDPDSSVCLTVALALFYAQNRRIQVFEDPGLIWYRRFGKCLLGATHGHSVKMSAMPMMMAADRPQDWGETLHRTMYSGHIHHESAKEIGPVRVESFTTPAARDAYAQSGGYRSGRAMTAITYHREDGEIGRHRVNITTTPLSGQRAA
jgi:hypothetical protein